LLHSFDVCLHKELVLPIFVKTNKVLLEVYLFQSNAVFMHFCDVFNPLSDVKNFVIWFESLTVIYEDRVVKNVMHKAVNKL